MQASKADRQRDNGATEYTHGRARTVPICKKGRRRRGRETSR